MAEQPVRYEVVDSVAWLTINRPEARNALNNAVRTGLFDAVRRFNDDDAAKVLVLTGVGDKAFCAGGDLKEMAQNALKVPPKDFAPQFGRNIDYVIAKELFANRPPELLVLQVAETEGRRPHPAFITLADPIEVLTEPVAINLDWAKNLHRATRNQKIFSFIVNIKKRQSKHFFFINFDTAQRSHFPPHHIPSLSKFAR